MLKSRSIVAGLALAFLLAGCGDSTAPEKNDFTLTVALDGTPSWTVADTPDGPLLTCTIGMTVTGHGAGRATLTGATEYWFIGADRSASVDTTTNSSADFVSAFGTASIGDGESHHTFWIFKFFAPFEVTMNVEYTRPDGHSTGKSGTHFMCGPTVQGAVVPAVAQINVPNMSGELKTGDTVSVSYQSTGSSGIWMSVIDATGTFKSEQVVSEQMATSVNRTVKFVVPNAKQPGVPLTISVRSFNAALVGAAKSLETQLTAVDRVPPTVSDVYVLERLGQSGALIGQYAVGDNLMFFATGHDDNALAWLVYELGPPANVKDSVAATPGQLTMYWTKTIAVKPEWVGSPLMKVYVRDAAGLTSNIVASPQDSLRFYPIGNRPTTTPLQLSTEFESDDMAYDAKRDLMFVGIPGEKKIAVFSPSTMTAEPPIVLPEPPAGMDLSLSGDSLLVAVPNLKSIAVVDLTHLTTAPTMLAMPMFDTLGTANIYNPALPSGLRIAANGKMFVLLSWATRSNDEVAEVDLNTGVQRVRTDARNLSTAYPFWTRIMERSGDRSRIYELGTCAGSYDSATDTWNLCQTSFLGIKNVGVNVDGTRLTAGGSILGSNLRSVWSATAINQQLPNLAMSPDASTIYLGALQGITTMRFTDKVMLERIPIPLTAERLYASPNGAWVLAFQNSYGARVTRIDLR